MLKNPDSSKYPELFDSRACERHCFEEVQHGRTFVVRHYYRVLIESMVNDLHDPEQKRQELLQEDLASLDISDLPKPKAFLTLCGPTRLDRNKDGVSCESSCKD